MPESSINIIKAGIRAMDAPFSTICQKILDDHEAVLRKAPGSRHNHQAWQGGYLDHIAETFELAGYLIKYKPERQRNLRLADVYLVMFLHDIEKPFAYDFTDNGTITTRPELSDKKQKKAFRENFLKKYGLTLTPEQENALRYVEGVPDIEYTPNKLTQGKLAAFCHILDTFSARIDCDDRTS